MKNRRRRSSKRRDPSQPSTRTEAESIPTQAVQSTAEIGGVKLGIGNVTRKWNYGDITAPFMFLRRVNALAGFFRGWSATALASDGRPDANDANAACLNTETDVDSELYPVTPYAQEFSTQIWPVLSDIFQSSLGTRYSISRHEFVRYNARIIQVYQWFLYALNVNYLTYHFDWKVIFPYTDQVPTQMYVLADLLDATDIGILESWKPLMDRFEQKVCFPRVLATVKRTMNPVLMTDGHTRLLLPTPAAADPTVTTGSKWREEIQKSLDYIDNNLAQSSAVINTFLPFPISDQNPWAIVEAGLVDVAKSTGMYNSGITRLDEFGDTGADPEKNEVLMFTTNTGSTTVSAVIEIPFATRNVQPNWDEIRNATIFEFFADLTDDAWRLISPNQWCEILIPETEYAKTTGTVVTVDTDTDFNANDNNDRLLPFIESRFASAQDPSNRPDYGIVGNGYLTANVYKDTMDEMIRLEVQEKFSFGSLRAVKAVTAGASVRVVRERVLELVNATL